MSKYLVFQDGHAKAVNSANRLGNYFNDWLLKFDEMLSIAKNHNAKAIIDNGDLFHAPKPSYGVLDEIADRTEKNGIPILSLYGNHSTQNHSIEHSSGTGLNHLIKRSQYFYYLPEYYFDDMEVKCVEYSNDIEDRLKKENLLNFETDKMRIGFIHAFVSEKEFPFCTHVVCKDVKNNGNCTLFIGHLHQEYDIVIKDTRFLNLACFGRNSITEANIKPKIAIIDTDNREIEIINLKSAKKPEEIFDLEKMKELKKNDKDLEMFIKSIESADFQSSNIKDIVKTIAKEKKVEKEVVNLILDNLENNNE